VSHPHTPKYGRTRRVLPLFGEDHARVMTRRLEDALSALPESDAREDMQRAIRKWRGFIENHQQVVEDYQSLVEGHGWPAK
jgi:hypothetical protein